ncbi:MAG: hypothetical protein ACI9J3_001467 [Parvicellaceae bacterium]|jgi:hypothetical protein
MKALILGTFACLMLISGIAAPNIHHAPPATKLVTTVSFSVKVNSGSTALDGAKVSILQDGVVVSTGTTMRGKAQVYIENDKDFTLQVTANGHKNYSKHITAVTQSEVITVALNKLVMSSKGVKPRK